MGKSAIVFLSILQIEDGNTPPIGTGVGHLHPDTVTSILQVEKFP